MGVVADHFQFDEINLPRPGFHLNEPCRAHAGQQVHAGSHRCEKGLLERGADQPAVDINIRASLFRSLAVGAVDVNGRSGRMLWNCRPRALARSLRRTQPPAISNSMNTANIFRLLGMAMVERLNLTLVSTGQRGRSVQRSTAWRRGRPEMGSIRTECGRRIKVASNVLQRWDCIRLRPPPICCRLVTAAAAPGSTHGVPHEINLPRLCRIGRSRRHIRRYDAGLAPPPSDNRSEKLIAHCRPAEASRLHGIHLGAHRLRLCPPQIRISWTDILRARQRYTTGDQ